MISNLFIIFRGQRRLADYTRPKPTNEGGSSLFHTADVCRIIEGHSPHRTNCFKASVSRTVDTVVAQHKVITLYISWVYREMEEARRLCVAFQQDLEGIVAEMWVKKGRIMGFTELIERLSVMIGALQVEILRQAGPPEYSSTGGSWSCTLFDDDSITSVILCLVSLYPMHEHLVKAKGCVWYDAKSD